VTEIAHQLYEQTLVLRSQIGDEAAFEELVHTYSPRLRLYVQKMLQRQPELTEDIVQDVWVSAFRGLPKLQDIAAFRSWVFRIARDRVFREFRKRHIEFLLLEETTIAEVPVSEHDNGDCDIEAIHHHLEQLSSEHREALILRFIEDMSYDEIARVTGSTLGTVRSRIHYAKRALRRAFEEKKV